MARDAIVIGGGISGIGSVIALREAGFEDVLLIERSEQLGGTWRDNTYPGCACDVPSALYQWSFAKNPDWSHVFARQEEIREYVLGVAEANRVDAVARTGVEVLEAAWHSDECEWVVRTSEGEERARHLIIAAGPLHEPVLPGEATGGAFEGEAFHSSRWNHEVDLKGKRVAIVGTGASCVQFLPRVQREAESVVVLQRTPGWVLPKPDRKVGPRERRLLRRFPALCELQRQLWWGFFDLALWVSLRPRLVWAANFLGKLNIRRSIKDRELRRALTPDYPFGCKRGMLSNDYYPALAKPNVKLVPSGLSEVRARSVVAADGSEHEVDVLIYGTGFHVSDLPIAARVRGKDGSTMAEVWDGAPRALYGTTTSGFPNAFMIFGPNIGTISAFVMLESQLSYIVSAMTQMRSRGLGSIEVRPESVEAFKSDVERKLAGSVFRGGCNSYYQDSKGGIYSVWPGTMRSMARTLKRCDLADYEATPVAKHESIAERA